MNLYSVSKGFTAVALGLAEAEGRLSLDDRLLDHFPELAPVAADGVERITLYQPLTMSSRRSHEWFADQPIHAPDLLAEIVAAPLVAEPGTRFNYTGSGPYAAARAGPGRPGRPCGTTCCPGCSPRWACSIRNGCAARWATPPPKATCSCGPRSWAGSPCCWSAR
ncbi:MAG: serine hydrolase domain-containing protein [Nakamurella multipartita]